MKFVTHERKNINYKLLKTLTPADKLLSKDGLEFRQDVLVHLFATGNQEIKEPIRLIEAVRLKNDKPLYFLTNIMDLDAAQIASIYKQRWDIEVFFRFMKQEMNFTHFVCHEDNAILVMLYCTLIASMLLSSSVEIEAGIPLELLAYKMSVQRDAVDSYPPINSLSQLHDAWFAKLPNPQVRILKALIEIYPDSLAKDDLAQCAEQSFTSSGYTNNLGTLCGLGLIDYPQKGYTAATELLFPEGLF